MSGPTWVSNWWRWKLLFRLDLSVTNSATKVGFGELPHSVVSVVSGVDVCLDICDSHIACLSLVIVA